MQFTLEALGPIADIPRGTVWTSAELAAEVRRRVPLLRAHGAGPGRHVVIAHGGTPAFFADLFAVWQSGACAVCTDAGLTAGEMANIVDFVDPRCVLVDGAAKGGGTGLAVPVIDAGREPPPATGAGVDARSGGLDDPALILFTSGTTGTPKGVVHSFRSLLARVALNRAHIGMPALERSLCVLPTHFGHGLIGNCLTPLLAGRSLFLYCGMGVRGAAGLDTVLAENGITFMSSVPSFWKIVLKVAKPPERQTLRQVHVGSAPLSADHWRAIMEWAGTSNVLNMYGITETANWLAGGVAGEEGAADGLVGAMWGGQAAVLTEDGRLAATGEGELAVQSPSLMQGYFRQAELTATVLRDGWFFTGDLGRIGDDGLIRITGRRKNEINRAGMKIQPEEIDLLLERHPDVLEACAFGIPDEISGEMVAVAVRFADAAGDREGGGVEALRAWCRERLRRESVPERWFVVPEIPKTDRGKISRQKVMDYCLTMGKANA